MELKSTHCTYLPGNNTDNGNEVILVKKLSDEQQFLTSSKILTLPRTMDDKCDLSHEKLLYITVLILYMYLIEKMALPEFAAH